MNGRDDLPPENDNHYDDPDAFDRTIGRPPWWWPIYAAQNPIPSNEFGNPHRGNWGGVNAHQDMVPGPSGGGVIDGSPNGFGNGSGSDDNNNADAYQEVIPGPSGVNAVDGSPNGFGNGSGRDDNMNANAYQEVIPGPSGVNAVDGARNASPEMACELPPQRDDGQLDSGSPPPPYSADNVDRNYNDRRILLRRVNNYYSPYRTEEYVFWAPLSEAYAPVTSEDEPCPEWTITPRFRRDLEPPCFPPFFVPSGTTASGNATGGARPKRTITHMTVVNVTPSFPCSNPNRERYVVETIRWDVGLHYRGQRRQNYRGRGRGRRGGPNYRGRNICGNGRVLVCRGPFHGRGGRGCYHGHPM